MLASKDSVLQTQNQSLYAKCFQSQTPGNTCWFHSSSRRDGMPVLRGARGDGVIDTALIHSENDDKIPGQHFLQLQCQLPP